MRPKINSVGIKIENNLLEIDLSNINIDKNDIAEIMKKYKLKKKYHRLKNGEFVDLENTETMDILDKISESTNASFEELISGELKLPIYRGMYLDKILKKNENIVVKKGEAYRQLIDDVYNRQISDKFKIPKGLKADLREYQQVGFDVARASSASLEASLGKGGKDIALISARLLSRFFLSDTVTEAAKSDI